MKQVINIILVLILPMVFEGSMNVQSQVYLSRPELIYPEHNFAYESKPDIFIWNKVENADNYDIQITTDVTFNNINNLGDINIVSHNDTSYSPSYTDLLKDTMYFWKVKAKNNTDLESDWSYIGMFLTGTTGIFSFENDSNIVITPMPISNSSDINIRISRSILVNKAEGEENSQLKIYIFNASGIMFKEINAKLTGDIIKLDASWYTPGSYHLVFTNNSKILGVKAIIVE